MSASTVKARSHFTLRRATRADQGAIRRMIFGAMLDPTSLDWRNFVLAIDDTTQTSRVIGCAQIKRYADCNEFGSLVVLRAYREHGIGGQLLRALCDAEPGPLYLVCLDKMQTYYERFGFARVALDESPRTLRIKQRAGRIFGVPVICMRRNP
jgi:amino-acid N-acetyltransferase